MPKSIKRTYSRYSCEAAMLMGKTIKLARKELGFTAQDLADRAGISRGLLQRIEKGDLKCEIGAVFEVATILGVRLLDASSPSLVGHIGRIHDKLALLPKSVRKKTKKVDDDF